MKLLKVDGDDLLLTEGTGDSLLLVGGTVAVGDYLVFRRTPPTGVPFDPEVDTPIAEVPSTQLTYDDEGLVAAEYEYQVFARKVE